jgi:hypothetical protein
MRVVKRSGEVEDFDPAKAINAILRIGTSPEEAQAILESVKPHLYDGMTTEELYRRIRSALPEPKAQQFSLKKAIMLLGPEGHAFESLMGRVFEQMGYEVLVRQILPGKCVSHEVDVVIVKDGKKATVECKFHNALGIKSGIQEALYTWGRFLDIKDTNGIDVPWLVTNTKLSSDVVQYGECVGMKLLGWQYPQDGSLEDLIEMADIYPLTVLDIRRGEQRTLLDHDFVICRDITERKAEMLSLFPREAAERILKKTEEFCGSVRR